MGLKGRQLYLRIIVVYVFVMFVVVYTNLCIVVSGITIEQNIAPVVTDVPIEQEAITTNQVISFSLEEDIAGFDEGWLANEEEVMLSLPEPTPTPTPVIDEISKFSEQDIYLLQRVTMSESSTQSFEVNVAVAQTVINRLHSGEFGDTIDEIVHTKYQYSTADNGDPSQQVIDAVIEAINNSPYPSDMYYFREDHYHKWADDYKKIGVFYFSTEP